MHRKRIMVKTLRQVENVDAVALSHVTTTEMKQIMCKPVLIKLYKYTSNVRTAVF